MSATTERTKDEITRARVAVLLRQTSSWGLNISIQKSFGTIARKGSEVVVLNNPLRFLTYPQVMVYENIISIEQHLLLSNPYFEIKGPKIERGIFDSVLGWANIAVSGTRRQEWGAKNNIKKLLRALSKEIEEMTGDYTAS